jgi:septum site-determining protein MinD
LKEDLTKSYAVHSYKGGTGKSCITASLASVLAQKGKNICLLEYDFRGPSLHSLFKENSADYWMNDYLDGLNDLDEVLTNMSPTLGTKGKFFVGLADPNPTRIKDMLVKDRGWEQKSLKRILKAKEDIFTKLGVDYLFFDTSPGLQYCSINAIAASDAVILITKVDVFDFEGTSRMIPEIYEPLEKKVGLLINQVVPGIEHHIDEITKSLNLPLLGKVPLYADESTYLLTKHILPIEYTKHPFTAEIQKITDKILQFTR